MKYKYDKYLNLYPESSVDSNIKEIRDTEIGYVDMQEFIDRVKKAPARLTNLINSELQKYASFPVAAHDPEFVLAVADHFDPTTRHVKDEDQNVIMTLDSVFFNSVFKGSLVEEVADITQESAQRVLREERG